MTGGLENTGMDEQLLPDFLAVEERREKAYRLYCQGQSYRRIGVALGLGKSRAGELVNEALQERRDELKAKTEEVRARELAKLEHIYSETWEAYDRSKSEATETETRQEKRTVKGRGAGDKTAARVKKKQRDGDGKLLKTLLDIRTQIQLLKGLTRVAEVGDEVPVQILRSDKNYNPADDV